MKVRSNRIGDIRNHYRLKLLDNYAEREADTLIFSLIEGYTGISKAKVFSEPNQTVSESELLKIHFAVKDLNDHKPIQYILGQTEFYGLRINVNPGVLIPRPETEELASLIVRENDKKEHLCILDIGTGSGCIALALKKYLHDSEVVAVDFSKPAIETAQINANANGQKIKFFCLDFLDEKNWSQLGVFDIIVSNPPYVRVSEKSFMKKNVLNHEPETALFVDDDNPLIFYRAIAQFANQNLAKPGIVYCEINQYLGGELTGLFREYGFADVELIKDFNGNNRFIKVHIEK